MRKMPTMAETTTIAATTVDAAITAALRFEEASSEGVSVDEIVMIWEEAA